MVPTNQDSWQTVISPLIWKILQIQVKNDINQIKKSKSNVLTVNEEMAKQLIKDEIISWAGEKTLQASYFKHFWRKFIEILNKISSKLVVTKLLETMSFDSFYSFVKEDLYENKTDKNVLDEFITEVFFFEFKNKIDQKKIDNAKSIFLDKESTVLYNYITVLFNRKNIINADWQNGYNPRKMIAKVLYEKNLETINISRDIQENQKIFNIENKSKLNLSNLNSSIYDFLKESKKMMSEYLPQIDKLVELKNTNLDPKIILINISDFHFNETCRHRARPEFDWTPERALATLNRILDYLIKEIIPKYNVQEIKILALGDIVWFWIHDQIKQDMIIWPDTAKSIMTVCLSQLFLYINKNIAPTEMIIVPWNHAEKRLWKERPLKAGDENYDSLLAREIASLLNQYWFAQKIIFPKGDEHHVYKTIGKKGYVFSHWDFPIWTALALSDSQYKWPNLDYSIIWHYHHPEIRKIESNLKEYILPNTNLPDEYTVMEWFNRSSYHNWGCLIVNANEWNIEEYLNFDINKYKDIWIVNFRFEKLFENEHLLVADKLKELYGTKVIKDHRIDNPLKINKNTIHSISSFLEEIKKQNTKTNISFPIFKPKFFVDLEESIIENKQDKYISGKLLEIKERTLENFLIRKDKQPVKYEISCKSKWYQYSEELWWILMLWQNKSRYIYDTLSNLLYAFTTNWKTLVSLKDTTITEFIKENKLEGIQTKDFNKIYKSLQDIQESKDLQTELNRIYKGFLIDYPEIFIETKEDLLFDNTDIDSLFQI